MYEKLLLVQQEIGAIKKDQTNPHFKNSYFDINSLLNVVKPILNGHKLVLTQALTTVDNKLALDTTITDSETNDVLQSICPLPECPDAQKYGAAITYFRRYALTSLLALEAEDNDGEFTEVSYDNDEPTTKPQRR